MGGGHDVDRELERMKVELGGGEAPREIEGSAPDAAGDTSTSERPGREGRGPAAGR